MKNIKSKKAINYINKNKEYMIDSSIQTGYYITDTKIMRQAIYIAEQDAEQRAINIVDKLIRNYIGAATVPSFVSEFAKLLNNKEQNNENDN